MALIRDDQHGIDALSQLILGSVNRQNEMNKQKQLGVQQAQEMLPIEQQQGEQQNALAVAKANAMLAPEKAQYQQKSDIDIAKSGKERQGAIDTMSSMRDAHPDWFDQGAGVNVSKEGVSVSKGFNPNQLAMTQMSRMGSEGKTLNSMQDKALNDVNTHINSLDRINGYLSNPTPFNTKQLGIDVAKMDEGEKARIQQGIIQAFQGKGDDKSISAMANDAWNKWTGQAQGPLTSDQLAAINTGLQTRRDQAKEALQSAKGKFEAQARLAAPYTYSSNPALATSAFNQQFDSLVQRHEAMQKASQALPQQQQNAQAAPQLAPSNPNAQNPGGIAAFLQRFMPSKQPQAQPMQQAPQGQNDGRQEGATGTHKGKPVIFKNGQWEYK
jgi:hypothetical protein